MKKNIIRIIIAAVTALATPTAMNAQLSNLLNGVKEAMGNKSTTNTVTDALVNLLGSDKITEKKLAGTRSARKREDPRQDWRCRSISQD